MARDNYSYQKYRRELAKKKKREEKLQRKLDKKSASKAGTPIENQEGQPADAPEQPLDGTNSQIQ